MDQDTLVMYRVEEAGKLVDRLREGGFEVAAAFWLKASWDGKLRFYIASPIVDREGLSHAYGRLYPLVQATPRQWIGPLEIRLIGATDPIARDVLAILRSPNGARTGPFPWNGSWLGTLSIDEAYLYPLPAGAPG